MPRQWNGTLATQVVPFRGSSTVDILAAGTAGTNFRTISGAVYALNVAGGVSGSFGAHILGMVGGVTFMVAGNTAISAVGNYIMYPTGYSHTGALQGLGSFIDQGAANRIINFVPPVKVVFQSGVATAGISANCTVYATLHQDD
jgi:hypothetical protein